jgi:Domain of unknown function (DUF4279)
LAVVKRFDVELWIVHPTMDPARIDEELSIEASVVHCVGDQRKTPKGTLLTGTYGDTRWRHSRRFETSDQHFVDGVMALVADIEEHKAFFHELRSTGGRACVIVQFLGDGYFGDEMPRDLLKRIVDLELDFGIECYTEPQSSE